MTSTILKTSQLSAILGASALALGACGGSSAPTRQLVDARRVYGEAQNSVASTLAPDSLASAQQSLAVAEKEHKDDPGSLEEAHLAYLAERKARIAFAEGQTAASEQAERQAKLNYQAKLEQEKRLKQGALANAQSELENMQQGKSDAEARAAAAMQELQEIASVREGLQGTVITLSGSVLFETGKDTLSDHAQSNLDKVAAALERQPAGTPIRIEGFTDTTGAAAYNEALSQRRAQTVRDYLSKQGVPDDSLKAVGRGESEPVASNDTAEGRASNRRVEIVVQPRSGQAPGQFGSAPGKTPKTSSSAKTPPDVKTLPDTEKPPEPMEMKEPDTMDAHPDAVPAPRQQQNLQP